MTMTALSQPVWVLCALIYSPTFDHASNKGDVNIFCMPLQAQTAEQCYAMEANLLQELVFSSSCELVDFNFHPAAPIWAPFPPRRPAHLH